MRKSEILDNFVKIAQDKGMISSDAPDKAKQKLENNPRADSMSVDDIQKLYNQKIDKPKEYKTNIMELAHPSPVVVAPSYDKVNGLIESEIERQNIDLHIVNKQPHCQLDRFKYAKKDFVLNLVRVANYLDNNDEEELRVLADSCLQKVALFMPIVLGIGSVMAALYLYKAVGETDTTYQSSYGRLMGLINHIKTSDITLGVGRKYDPTFKSELGIFGEKIKEHNNTYRSNMNLLSALYAGKSKEDIIKTVKDINPNELDKKMMDMKSSMIDYKNLLDDKYAYLKAMMDANPLTFQHDVAETGFFTRVTDFFLQGPYKVFRDEMQELTDALQAMVICMKNQIKTLDKYNDIKSKVQSEFASTTTTAKSTPPSTSTPTATSVPTESSKPPAESEGLAGTLLSFFK